MAKKLAFQGAANRIVRGLLRTPGVCRLIGSRLVTVYFVGRKSGRQFAIPVAYVQDDDDLLVGTPFRWGTNLRTGQPVDIRLKGARRRFDVLVISDEDGVVDSYATMAAANRQFAGFNGIELDGGGRPNPADLHRAWREGARAFRFRPL